MRFSKFNLLLVCLSSLQYLRLQAYAITSNIAAYTQREATVKLFLWLMAERFPGYQIRTKPRVLKNLIFKLFSLYIFRFLEGHLIFAFHTKNQLVTSCLNLLFIASHLDYIELIKNVSFLCFTGHAKVILSTQSNRLLVHDSDSWIVILILLASDRWQANENKEKY